MFAHAYEATPAWEIGRPQAPFVAIAGELTGRVLDAGCGTGELAMMAAARGLDATGVDGAVAAIAIARQRAEERDLTVDFRLGNVHRLAEVAPGPYAWVLDSGLFHVFEDGDRARYVEQLSAVTVPGSHLALMCFSDEEPGDWGPHRVSRDDLRTAFADGWRVDSIEPSLFVLAHLPSVQPQARAWFARFTRL